MGWSGRAPAPAASDPCEHQEKKHAMTEALKDTNAYASIDIDKSRSTS
jgi:hypothetical protein